MNIKAEVIADSIDYRETNRITTISCTFPRIILSELNTHRMFSRNSASSRAIPFHIMLRSVLTNPFIPMAWQADHKGMQGAEYLRATHVYTFNEAFPKIQELIRKVYPEGEYAPEVPEDYLALMQDEHRHMVGTLQDWWLVARDKAVEAALILSAFGLTKQLCNRLLEPFMYHTALITSTEWENFFQLRCPQYNIGKMIFAAKSSAFPSKKDAVAYTMGTEQSLENMSESQWLAINDGQAEIHIMALAESIWDAMNESKPKVLQGDEWHIPFEENITAEMFNEAYPVQPDSLNWYHETFEWFKTRVSTVMSARTSYTIPDGELSDWSGKKYFTKYDELKASRHASPFEHAAKCMNDEEYRLHTLTYPVKSPDIVEVENGVCRNFRGFIQLRAIENL